MTTPPNDFTGLDDPALKAMLDDLESQSRADANSGIVAKARQSLEETLKGLRRPNSASFAISPRSSTRPRSKSPRLAWSAAASRRS